MAASQTDHRFPLCPYSEKDGCLSASFQNNDQLCLSLMFPLPTYSHSASLFSHSFVITLTAFKIFLMKYWKFLVRDPTRRFLTHGYVDKYINIPGKCCYYCEIWNKSDSIPPDSHRFLVGWSAGFFWQEARSQWGSGGRLLGTAVPPRWRAATGPWQRWHWRGGTGPTRCSGCSCPKTQCPERRNIRIRLDISLS